MVSWKRLYTLNRAPAKRGEVQADQLLIERRQKKWGRMKVMHLARREALYARALQAADYRTALAVLQDLAKLQDLYMDERELRKVQRELKELDARMKALPPIEGADRLETFLNDLPSEDKVRLAKLLRERKYNSGETPADPQTA